MNFRIYKIPRPFRPTVIFDTICNVLCRLLSESRGSLLDDDELVESLKRSKFTSIEVEEKLISNEKTETVIDAAREVSGLKMYFTYSSV